MQVAPPGLEIIETRLEGPARITYAARQMPLGRAVQVVALAPGVLLTSPLARGLVHEAEVLAELDHPSIVRLFDLRQDDEQILLVLEDVDGISLAKLGPQALSWRGAAAVGLELARALNHAHGRGHTHGQLSLHSVALTREGLTKLSGFGRAPRPQDDRLEALEPISPGGLSPEASVGQATGSLGDIFAWGALMYELLSGRAPFGSVGDSQYPMRVRNDRPKPLIAESTRIPPALHHLVERCLEKLPAERPAHAAELAEQLEALIGTSTPQIIKDDLERISLGDKALGAVDLEAEGKGSAKARTRGFSPLVAAALAGAAITGAATFIAMKAPTKAHTSKAVARTIPSEQALLLRVVASPWAHVLVDGEHLETTPFARPLALSPGKHVVRLEHPSAPAEERTVEGRAGQAVLLNVQMHVERPLEQPTSAQILEEASP